MKYLFLLPILIGTALGQDTKQICISVQVRCSAEVYERSFTSRHIETREVIVNDNFEKYYETLSDQNSNDQFSESESEEFTSFMEALKKDEAGKSVDQGSNSQSSTIHNKEDSEDIDNSSTKVDTHVEAKVGGFSGSLDNSVDTSSNEESRKSSDRFSNHDSAEDFFRSNEYSRLDDSSRQTVRKMAEKARHKSLVNYALENSKYRENKQITREDTTTIQTTEYHKDLKQVMQKVTRTTTIGGRTCEDIDIKQIGAPPINKDVSLETRIRQRDYYEELAVNYVNNYCLPEYLPKGFRVEKPFYTERFQICYDDPKTQQRKFNETIMIDLQKENVNLKTQIIQQQERNNDQTVEELKTMLRQQKEQLDRTNANLKTQMMQKEDQTVNQIRTMISEQTSQFTSQSQYTRLKNLLHTNSRQVRLADVTTNGSVRSYLSYKGRLEVWYGGSFPWKTVCDNTWKLTATTVACKQLGFTTGTHRTVKSHEKSSSSGSWDHALRNIKCSGTEKSIWDCTYTRTASVRSSGLRGCRSSEDIYLTCF